MKLSMTDIGGIPMTRLTVDLDTEKTTVTLPGDQGIVTLSAAPLPAPEHGVQLPISDGRFALKTAAPADEYRSDGHYSEIWRGCPALVFIHQFNPGTRCQLQ